MFWEDQGRGQMTIFPSRGLGCARLTGDRGAHQGHVKINPTVRRKSTRNFTFGALREIGLGTRQKLALAPIRISPIEAVPERANQDDPPAGFNGEWRFKRARPQRSASGWDDIFAGEGWGRFVALARVASTRAKSSADGTKKKGPPPGIRTPPARKDSRTTNLETGDLRVGFFYSADSHGKGIPAAWLDEGVTAEERPHAAKGWRKNLRPARTKVDWKGPGEQDLRLLRGGRFGGR